MVNENKMLKLNEAEKTWLEELASAWGVKLIFREYLGADMFARITISSEGDAWVEILQSFDPEDYYSQWGNRDIAPPELFRFLLLHEIAHVQLKHEKEKIPNYVRTKEIGERSSENERQKPLWAKRRLRDPGPGRTKRKVPHRLQRVVLRIVERKLLST